jgi:KUP system potassium uptake protein
MAARPVNENNAPKHGLSGLALTAIGIVFGDIGTSPLYTFKTVLDFSGGHPTHEIALGLLSLIVWTLLITVSLKYVTFVMRADNDGEGGILALMSLLKTQKRNSLILACGLFGAALIYGDGAITPAISVLSAVEGIKVVSPIVAPFVLPFCVIILFTLFAVQYHGTTRIGWVFGPVMALWFVAIGILGIGGIAQYPAVLMALNPWYGVHYLLTSGWTGFTVLGGVFLAVTGAEALYADMGHIGARPIRVAWYGLVLPTLLFNYAGQTALLLAGVPIEDNIFYRLCPHALLIPFIGLATAATIIASQAIITGAFSMTRQAIQLGFCPRFHITQTSAGGYGQIYVGTVNWLLMLATLGLTIGFGSSDNLAAAYGIAVSLTMLLTTTLLFIVMRHIWRWNLLLSLLTAGVFFVVDATFFTANSLKILQGGWVPLALAIAVYIPMIIWQRGTTALKERIQSMAMPVDYFLGHLITAHVARVPGTGVFLTQSVSNTPPILIWHVAHNRALQERVVALTLTIQPVPWVAADKRVVLQTLAPGFWRVTVNYGFMDKVDVPAVLLQLKGLQCDLDLRDVTYYVSHETVLARADGGGLPHWQVMLYGFMRRNSAQLSEYLNLPGDRVVELGRQVEI